MTWRSPGCWGGLDTPQGLLAMARSWWGWDPSPLAGGLCLGGFRLRPEPGCAHHSCSVLCQSCLHRWGWLGPALSHGFASAPLGHRGLWKESRELCEEQRLAQVPSDRLHLEEGLGAATPGVQVARLSWAWGNHCWVPQSQATTVVSPSPDYG